MREPPPDPAIVKQMKAEIDNAMRKAGGAAGKPVVMLPASAVRDNAVFVVLDGKALRRAVKTGAASGQNVRIEEGLIGGEDVIANPPAGLKDGERVRARM